MKPATSPAFPQYPNKSTFIEAILDKLSMYGVNDTGKEHRSTKKGGNEGARNHSFSIIHPAPGANLPPQVSLGHILVNLITEKLKLILAELMGPPVLESGGRQDSLGCRLADAIDILKAGLNPLLVGDLNTADTGVADNKATGLSHPDAEFRAHGELVQLGNKTHRVEEIRQRSGGMKH